MESITAFAWGPGSFLIAWGMVNLSAWRYPLMIIVSLGQIYGDVLYYITCILEGLKHSRPEPLYFWFYFVVVNALWVIIPSMVVSHACEAGSWAGREAAGEAESACLRCASCLAALQGTRSSRPWAAPRGPGPQAPAPLSRSASRATPVPSPRVDLYCVTFPLFFLIDGREMRPPPRTELFAARLCPPLPNAHACGHVESLLTVWNCTDASNSRDPASSTITNYGF